MLLWPYMAHARGLPAPLGILSILLVSGVAHAAGASFPAGFAPGPVWLSQSTPTAGASVRLYTVVYNSSQTPLEGAVTFKVDNTSVGESPFSLETGESAIESITWTATEGTHQVSAAITSAIEKKSKAVATIDQSVTTSLAVVVAPAAPKPAALEALDTAQTVVASSSPVVASVVALTTAATESLRTMGESYLSNLAGETRAVSAIRPKSSVLGAATEASSTPGTVTQKAAKALLPIFRYPALFYPILLFLLLLVVWVMVRRLRTPKRR